MCRNDTSLSVLDRGFRFSGFRFLSVSSTIPLLVEENRSSPFFLFFTMFTLTQLRDGNLSHTLFPVFVQPMLSLDTVGKVDEFEENVG